MGNGHELNSATTSTARQGLAWFIVAELGWPVVWSTCIALLFLSVALSWEGVTWPALVTGATLATMPVLALLLIRRQYSWFSFAYLGLATVGSTLLVAPLGGLSSPDVGGLYILVVLAAVLRGSRMALVMMAFVSGVVCLYGIAEIQGRTTAVEVSHTELAARVAALTVLTGVIVGEASNALGRLRKRVQTLATARRQNEETLKQSARLLGLLDLYLPGLLWISRRGHIELVGGEWARVTGLHNDQLMALPESLLWVVGPESRHQMADVVYSPCLWPAALTMDTPRGLRIMQVHAAPLGIDDLEMAVLVDVTDQRVQSVREARRRRALEGREQLEAVGRLASGVAHDVRNLLTVVQALSDMVVPQLGASERRDMQEVSEACSRATAITRDLLLVSRRPRADADIYEFEKAVRGTLALFRRVMSHEVKRVGKPAQVRVRGKPETLELFLFSAMAEYQATGIHEATIAVQVEAGIVEISVSSSVPLRGEGGWPELVGTECSISEGRAVFRIQVAEVLPDSRVVWLIEPNDMVAKVVQRALKKDGYEVHRSSDLPVPGDQDPILFVVDTTHARGRRFVSALEVELGEVPILSLGDEEGPGRLLKPFNTHQLRQAVTELLEPSK